MKISTIQSGLFKLDGGAMFGIVPKKLWSRMIDSDENNMCTWCMRCLLIETGDRKILVDTGMGNKQDEKFRSHFEPHGSYSLIGSLQEKGVNPSEITDVFITHLHFDHVGGAVEYNRSNDLVPSFPNAKYWMHKQHYDWAMHPNAREKASFLKENFVPLVEQGVVTFLDFKESQDWYDGITLRSCNGHTRSMMYMLIPYQGTKLVYAADLMPSSYHIGLPYVMAYDVEPLKSLQEKENMLREAFDHSYIVYYEHDVHTIASKIDRNAKGRLIKGESVII